ncbi:PAS domain-containing protein, partial [Burkholderia gladioli]|nr:PAS domain-containing protein [Burkholderia gladioli]
MPAPDFAEAAGQPRAERVADARRTIPIVPLEPLEPLEPAAAAAGSSDASAPTTSPAGLGALVSYLEHDPQPMIVVDPDYRILAANGAYQRQFGGAGRAHVGRHCYRVSHHYEVPCDQAGEH